jgi:sec-independent protein translocase protein TatC
MNHYLVEIRNRLFLVFCLQISTVLSIYYYKTILLFFMVYPILKLEKCSSSHFIYNDITEPFSVFCTLTLFISLQFVALYLLLQVFIFITPALYKSEFHILLLLVKRVLLLTLLSVVSAHFFIIPWLWLGYLEFYIISQDSIFNLNLEVKLDGYMSFYVSCYGLNFLYFHFIGFLFYNLNLFQTTLHHYKCYRKFYYLCFTSAAAAFCPDVYSQLIFILTSIFSFEAYFVKRLFLSFR